MSTSTIRLRPHSREALKQITELTGQSLQDALDQAIEDFRRKVYLDGLNADYAALDPDTRKEFQNENGVWDVTNEDGLEDA